MVQSFLKLSHVAPLSDCILEHVLEIRSLPAKRPDVALIDEANRYLVKDLRWNQYVFRLQLRSTIVFSFE